MTTDRVILIGDSYTSHTKNVDVWRSTFTFTKTMGRTSSSGRWTRRR